MRHGYPHLCSENTATPKALRRPRSPSSLPPLIPIPSRPFPPHLPAQAEENEELVLEAYREQLAPTPPAPASPFSASAALPPAFPLCLAASLPLPKALPLHAPTPPPSPLSARHIPIPHPPFPPAPLTFKDALHAPPIKKFWKKGAGVRGRGKRTLFTRSLPPPPYPSHPPSPTLSPRGRGR